MADILSRSVCLKTDSYEKIDDFTDCTAFYFGIMRKQETNGTDQDRKSVV